MFISYAADNVNYENEVSISNYSLSSNINFKNNFVNDFSYEETVNGKTTKFKYITNLNVKNSNIVYIIQIKKNVGKSKMKVLMSKKMELTP